MTSQIPPISHVQSSSSPSGEGAIQAILDRHCKDYPKEIPVGCNLVVMQEGKLPTGINFRFFIKIVPNAVFQFHRDFATI
jgi:hypothetical protein